jgi:hypothetical protein
MPDSGSIGRGLLQIDLRVNAKFLKTIMELKKWLGAEDNVELFTRALTLLLKHKEVLESGRTLCFHDREFEMSGEFQEFDIRTISKK